MKQLGGMSSLWNTGRFESVLKQSTRLRYLPWVVLLFTLAASWQLWQSAGRHALHAQQVEFDLRVEAAVDGVRQRMQNYEQALYGTRGFFMNQHKVEHREFHGYIESLELEHRFPGIQGVSYAPLVLAHDKQAHISAVRNDGLANYTILPAGTRGQYAPVAYIEPYAGRNLRVLGFDNFSSAQRRASLEKARDLDQAVVSEKLTLVQEDGKTAQPGCLMFLPVYKTNAATATLTERRANIAGWLAASFRMNDLLAGLLSHETGELGIEIYDGDVASEATLLFDSGSGERASPQRTPQFETVTRTEIAGRPWSIKAYSLPAFESGMDKSKAYLTAIASLLISIVLTWITAILVRDRSRAMKLAEGASSELRRNKEFQAALKESEQRWKLALEAAGHGVWDWDVQTDSVICSELSMQIIGCSADDCPTRFAEWLELIHPDDLQQMMAAYQLHLEGKAPAFIAECRFRCRNGQWKWIIMRAMVVERDGQGKPQRMLGTHTDISDRRAMQTALEEEKQFSDDIINSLPGDFYMLDENGRHVRWNKKTEEVTGYTAEEITRLGAETFFESEDRVAIREKIREVFETGEGEIEANLLPKDGKKIPYHFSLRRSTIGGKSYLIGVGFNISQRLEAETALRLSEAKLQAIIDHAPVGIWLVGVDGRYHFLNKTFCDALGMSEKEILAVGHISDILGPEIAAVCIQTDREALAQDEPHISYETLTFVDGKPHQLEVRKVKLHDHVGETIGVLGISVDITEQREREEALRESELRYREIFNDANYFIFTLDTASRITFAPPILAQVTGYDLEEIMGAHIGKILTPESLIKAQQMIAMKLQGEASVTQYEMDLLCRDGRTTPIEVNTSLIYRQGKVIGVQGAGRDITERHKYARSLRESEEKYRGLFESAGDFAYSTDLNGYFSAVSDALLEATGYEREELVNASISKILTPENLELAQRKTAVKLAGEDQVTRYEMEITAKDGRHIPVEIVSTLVFKDGKPVRVQGIGRDISERKQAEELLRRSERNYRELMEQATEAIFIYDQKMHCVDVNRAAQEMFGFGREEFLAFGMRDLVHQDDLVKLADPDEQARLKLMLEGEITIHGERRMRRKDDVYIPVQISAKRLSDGRVLSIKRDISEWLNREAALREANAKAEAASRAKSEFLANMSHEIRTPMNSVIGMARLALSRETDARQLDYLEKIMMSGEHLLGIIDDILDFSKIEAGRLQIESTDFDLRDVMDNLASLMAGRAAAKGLKFVVEVDPALPDRVQGDPLRLRQVLLNFADNALKFTAQGEVRISAKEIKDAGEAGCAVHFEVCDTGIGMNAVEMAMLFRPFQQTDGSVTRKYGGTGLGLSISKRLVEMMGGELGVKSEPGSGSTFWFRVRLDKGRPDAVQPVEHTLDRREIQAAIRNARILLAENNVFNQQVAREFLEIAGCVVHVANDGAQVLDLLQREHFDCVLMDVQMPVMDGMEATRQIRANQAFAAMPVIAVTANALEEERQRCMEAGMNDFITKPVRPEMLYAVLAKWLSRKMLPLSVSEWKKNSKDVLPQNDVIDFAVLADLVGDNPEKMGQMARKFIDSTRKDMARVEAALAHNDLAQLREMGHHTKSPAMMMGASGFAELCRALESDQNDLGSARELVGRMRAMWAEIEGRIAAQFS